MPGLTLQTDALILGREPPAEKFQRFTLFSAEHGVLTALQRFSTKPVTAASATSSATAPLDLFDEVAFVLDGGRQPAGSTWFVREARILQRRPGLACDYTALERASALARLVTRHQTPPETRGAHLALLRTALDAFATAPRPDITWFKTLYCFARDEGHPLRQHWVPTLPLAQQALAAELLQRPLAQQTADADAVAFLSRRLAEYLRGHCDIEVA